MQTLVPAMALDRVENGPAQLGGSGLLIRARVERQRAFEASFVERLAVGTLRFGQPSLYISSASPGFICSSPA